MKRSLLEPTDGVTIHVGDVREVLPTLPAESVDLVATSPPFFGLRDYGTGVWGGGDQGCDHQLRAPATREKMVASSTIEGSKATVGSAQGGYAEECGRCGARRVDSQIGLEATPEQWAAELVAVFRECRRLLRPGGSMFVECGDSYASNNGTYYDDDSVNGAGRAHRQRRSATVGYKPKDLIGSPFLLAFALRADGWVWRGCYIWAKPNGMPESAKDRCTVAHSYVLHFAKGPRYFFDADAIAEPAKEGDVRYGRVGAYQNRAMNGNGDGTTPTRLLEEAQTAKHPRSVWTIPTYGFPGAHFAVFPPRLVERMILAGCPREVCSVCGKARERITDGASYYHDRDTSRPEQKYAGVGGGHGGVGRGPKSNLGASIAKTVGWSDCGHDAYQPGTVLDPFFGSGTTGVVARRHGRHAVGVELNPTYARMAADRCAAWWRDPVREDERDDDGQLSIMGALGG